MVNCEPGFPFFFLLAENERWLSGVTVLFTHWYHELTKQYSLVFKCTLLVYQDWPGHLRETRHSQIHSHWWCCHRFGNPVLGILTPNQSFAPALFFQFMVSVISYPDHPNALNVSLSSFSPLSDELSFSVSKDTNLVMQGPRFLSQNLLFPPHSQVPSEKGQLRIKIHFCQ